MSGGRVRGTGYFYPLAAVHSSSVSALACIGCRGCIYVKISHRATFVDLFSELEAATADLLQEAPLHDASQAMDTASLPEEPQVAPVAAFPDPLPWASDSHFHIDRCRAAYWLLQSASVSDVCALSFPSRFQVRIRRAVANFCDASTYPSADEIDTVTTSGHAPS